MADKLAPEDKNKKNIKVIKSFRLKGSALQIGDVVSKDMFGKKGEWQNLCHMDPPKAEETSDPVGIAGKPKPAAKPAAKDTAKTTVKGAGGLPSA